MLRPADWLPPKRLLTPRSLAVPGVCYSALRDLPRRDLHPLETNSVERTRQASAPSRRTLHAFYLVRGRKMRPPTHLHAPMPKISDLSDL